MAPETPRKLAGPVRVVGIGAGGHARVLLDALQAAGETQVVGLLDNSPALKGTRVLGVEVLGGDELLDELHRQGVHHAFLGVGGTSDNSARRKVFELVKSRGFEFVNVVHPSAVIAGSSTMGEGTVVCAGAVVGAGARLGRNVIVNTGSVVEHDCVIGDHAHVASGAVLAGTVTVEEGAHVGAGAAVRQGLRIGARAVVALGAVVVDAVPDGVVVAGVPARPMQAGIKA